MEQQTAQLAQQTQALDAANTRIQQLEQQTAQLEQQAQAMNEASERSNVLQQSQAQALDEANARVSQLQQEVNTLRAELADREAQLLAVPTPLAATPTPEPTQEPVAELPITIEVEDAPTPTPEIPEIQVIEVVENEPTQTPEITVVEPVQTPVVVVVEPTHAPVVTVVEPTPVPQQGQVIIRTEAPRQDQEPYTVGREYRWGHDGEWHWALVVTNRTDNMAGFLAHVTFMDENGSLIDAQDAQVLSCSPGGDALLLCDTSRPFASVDYEIRVVDPLGIGPQRVVSVSAERSGTKVILTALNRAGIGLEKVEFTCLFLDATGNVVDSTWGYFSDLDGILRPGQTVMREESSAAEFEAVVVYLGGSGK